MYNNGDNSSPVISVFSNFKNEQWIIYKPEPKFSIDDLVVDENNLIFLIAEVLDNGYRLRCYTDEIMAEVHPEDSLRPYDKQK